jgi:hypothetical protein
MGRIHLGPVGKPLQQNENTESRVRYRGAPGTGTARGRESGMSGTLTSRPARGGTVDTGTRQGLRAGADTPHVFRAAETRAWHGTVGPGAARWHASGTVSLSGRARHGKHGPKAARRPKKDTISQFCPKISNFEPLTALLFAIKRASHPLHFAHPTHTSHPTFPHFSSHGASPSPSYFQPKPRQV